EPEDPRPGGRARAAMTVPSHARVVVIGGGIAGCSVAYHLTKLGWRDVVLLERRDLSCGTTWHAAGLVGQLRATANLTKLAKNGAVTGVATNQGDIACDVVVNCAGMWARALGALAGAAVPLHATEHFYIVTDPMPGVTPNLPVLRDPDGFIYVREEVGGLL